MPVRIANREATDLGLQLLDRQQVFEILEKIPYTLKIVPIYLLFD